MRERIIYGLDGKGPVAHYVDGELVFAREDLGPERNGNKQHVMPDIQPYRSMIDGTIINSRSQHREHLKAHGCIEVGNDSSVMNPKVKPLAPPPGLKDHLVRSYQQVISKRR